MERWRPFFDYYKTRVGDVIPCKQCGQVFTKRQYNELYCSKVCQRAAQIRKSYTRTHPEGAPREELREVCGRLWIVETQDAGWPFRTCARCGCRIQLRTITHAGVGVSELLCSECRERARAEREEARREKAKEAAKARLEPRVCEFCGKTYTPKTRHSRCCSHVCSSRNSFRKRKNGEPRVVRSTAAPVIDPCVICGGELPEGYVVHEACAAASPMKFDPIGIYKPGDKPKPFIYCTECGGLVEKGERVCHSCGFVRYNPTDPRGKK